MSTRILTKPKKAVNNIKVTQTHKKKILKIPKLILKYRKQSSFSESSENRYVP